MSVNIAAQSSVTFTLMYEELLQRKHGKYEILTRVKADQPVREFQVKHTFLKNDKVTMAENVLDTVCLCADSSRHL